jgi:hypothetical protein
MEDKLPAVSVCIKATVQEDGITNGVVKGPRIGLRVDVISEEVLGGARKWERRVE